MLRKMKKVSKVSFAFVLMLAILMSVPFTALATTKDERVVEDAVLILNDEIKQMGDIHIVDGRVYMAIGAIIPALSGSVAWDKVNREAVIMSKSDDKIVFGEDIPTVEFNGVRYELEAAPYSSDDRLYVPIRYIAEFLHARVDWDSEEKAVTLTSLPLEIVSEQNSINQISEKYNVSVQQLLSRNGYSNVNQVKDQSKLAYIIPSVLENKAKTYTEDEYKLLAKLVQVESGYESYEGQLAVANVILNRVKHPAFPTSIEVVIYSGKQFPPAHNGKLDKSVPNASVLRATKDAMNGKNNVEDAIYFFNPKVTKGSFWSSLEVIATIENHSFAK